MVADTTRLDDGHAPCADTTLRVHPGRSAGLFRNLVACLCPALTAGLFFEPDVSRYSDCLWRYDTPCCQTLND